MKSTLLTLRRLSVMVVAVAIAVATFGANPAAFAENGRGNRHWVGTWATSPQGLANSGAPDVGEFDNQTLRQIMRVSIGGKVLRVRFSNEFGEEPLVIGAARIALSDGGGSIMPGTSRQLTFGGEPSTIIRSGAPALSDPVNLRVPPLGDLAISIYLPNPTVVTTYHRRAIQTTYISMPGDHTEAVDLPTAATAVNWFFLSSVHVLASEEAAAIVTLGDSITDGTASTVDANARWPNFLAARLQAKRSLNHLAVLDQGISGNRVLHHTTGDNALARFDRDVLRQPGVKYVIVMEGINDIGFSGIGFPDQAVTPDEIIAGHRQLIARAHELGLTIYGATLTPFEGTIFAGYFTPEGEVKRQAVNDWIRTSGEYDGVIDFDEVVRDPANPTMILPEFNSGDFLHPSDTGYEAMGNSVDLKLFKAGKSHGDDGDDDGGGRDRRKSSKRGRNDDD